MARVAADWQEAFPRVDGTNSAARALPGAVFLRPLGELYVEAAEREEEAVRELRNGCRPFDSEVYARLDDARTEAGRIRRQVEAGVQDLLVRYDIAVQELDELERSAP